MPRVKRRGHAKRGEDVPIDRMTIDEMGAELRGWRDGGFDTLDKLDRWRYLKRTGDLSQALNDARVAEMRAGPMSKARVAYWLKVTGDNDNSVDHMHEFWNRIHQKPGRVLAMQSEAH